MWWTSAEPKLVASVTSVTDKVNDFFGLLGWKTPVTPPGKQSRFDNLLIVRSLSCNDLRPRCYRCAGCGYMGYVVPCRRTDFVGILRHVHRASFVKEQIRVDKRTNAARGL